MSVEMSPRGPLGMSISPGPFDMPEMDNSPATINPGNVASGFMSGSYSTGTAQGALSPVAVLIGLILLLVGMKFLGEHDKSEISPAHLHIGAYNLLGVTVTSIIGIVFSKLIFNRFQVPGVTDLVNAV